MSITIEDILKSHGVGNGAGINIVTSEEEPTTGLTEGLFWHRESDGQTKMLLGGVFKEIGGSGGGVLLIPFFGRATTTAVTSVVGIPVSNYNPTDDILFVSQNGINITESIDYLVDRETKQITKRSGVWDIDTVFDFTILSLTETSGAKDNVTLAQFEDHVTVAAGTETISFSIPGFNDETDVIRIHQRNLEVFRGIDWTMDANGSSITLNYTLDNEEDFHFTVLKKVRDQYPEGSIEGSYLIDGSIAKSALSVGLQEEINSKAQKSELAILLEDSEAHMAEDATLTTKGHVQLTTSTTSTSSTLVPTASALKAVKDSIPALNNTVTSASTTESATANAVKTAMDKANAALPANEKGVANGVAELNNAGYVTNFDGTLPGFWSLIDEISLSSSTTSLVISIPKPYRMLKLFIEAYSYNSITYSLNMRVNNVTNAYSVENAGQGSIAADRSQYAIPSALTPSGSFSEVTLSKISGSQTAFLQSTTLAKTTAASSNYENVGGMVMLTTDTIATITLWNGAGGATLPAGTKVIIVGVE